MTDIIMFLIGLIVVVVVLALLWRAGTLAAALAPLGEPWRTVVTILMLLVAVVVIWWLFGGYVRLP